MLAYLGSLHGGADTSLREKQPFNPTLKVKNVELWHKYSKASTQMFVFLHRKALSHADKLSV